MNHIRSPHQKKLKDYERQSRVNHEHRQPKPETVQFSKRHIHRSARHAIHQTLHEMTKALHQLSHENPQMETEMISDHLQENIIHDETQIRTMAFKERKDKILQPQRLNLGDWLNQKQTASSPSPS